MCGIAGYYQFDTATQNDQSKNLMIALNKMTSRGPDGLGATNHASGKWGLGSVRLAIQGVKKMNQPMISDGCPVTLVFNGEIYNFREIQYQLEVERAIDWVDRNSDTETLIHAYLSWGEGFVSKLDGIFSIAILDEMRQTLLLYRDHLGIKPLFLNQSPYGIFFSSSIDSLKTFLCDVKPSRAHFASYILYLSSFEDETYIKSVESLSPGSYLKVTNLGIKKVRYWDLNSFRPDLSRKTSRDNKLDELKFEIDKSISMQRPDSSHFGLALSGGVDSSYLAACSIDSRCIAGTIYFDKRLTPDNENENVTALVEKFGIQHFFREIGAKELVPSFQDFIARLDVPVGDPVAFTSMFLYQSMNRHHVKVCLVGEGPDELFGGYSFWHRLRKLENVRRSTPGLRYRSLDKVLSFHSSVSWKVEYMKRIFSTDCPIFLSGSEVISPKCLDLLGMARERENIVAKLISDFEVGDFAAREPLDWFAFTDLNRRMPNLLLSRVDTVSMMHSIEARVPYLGRSVVETILGLEVADRFDLRGPKFSFKTLLAESIQPLDAFGIKKGFSLPVVKVLQILGESRLTRAIEVISGLLDIPYEKLLTVIRLNNPNLNWALLVYGSILERDAI